MVNNSGERRKLAKDEAGMGEGSKKKAIGPAAKQCPPDRSKLRPGPWKRDRKKSKEKVVSGGFGKVISKRIINDKSPAAKNQLGPGV